MSPRRPANRGYRESGGLACRAAKRNLDLCKAVVAGFQRSKGTDPLRDSGALGLISPPRSPVALCAGGAGPTIGRCHSGSVASVHHCPILHQGARVVRQGYHRRLTL